ncbi:hypothetical protein K431DRAFT_289846 [Polychaeton citri CBS 116435]|uniref:FAD/NAD(P)-binding domain-containing protein n=1 Tax=Polychaeton citri CBS 116435 TaxID=1314669 RepID=A0A9P4PVW6_9PEZI|nr:hypothetical protein K431DRAFT_289846 [Polychaeton citri CBS 116435]
MSSSEATLFQAIIVGAGPAGIAAVGNLIDNGIGPICWVDEHFEGGRIHKHYREVPANLKVQGFVDFAASLESFVAALSRAEPNVRRRGKDESNLPSSGKFDAPCSITQDEDCALSYGADLCLALTQGLSGLSSVFTYKGRVDVAGINQPEGFWRIHLQDVGSASLDARSFIGRRLVLCTGSSPFSLPPPLDKAGPESLPLDTALSPSRLRTVLHGQSPLSILVVGSSHSAVLVLKNLTELALSEGRQVRIRWVYCQDLRYAEWANGKYIARDNSGLKGATATWAREHLGTGEPGCVTTERVIERVRIARRLDERELYHHCVGMDLIVQALGFKADPLPVLRNEASGAVIRPQFIHDTGGFANVADEPPTTIHGLYAAGIAFPALHWDEKYGEWEQAIGFPAFMRALKRWVPTWRPCPT